MPPQLINKFDCLCKKNYDFKNLIKVGRFYLIKTDAGVAAIDVNKRSDEKSNLQS